MTKNGKKTEAQGPKQELAIHYLANGISQTETAKRLHVTRQTIGNWIRDPLFLMALKKIQVQRLIELQNKHQHKESRIFEIMNEIMEDEKVSPRDRLRAAVELRNESHRLRESVDLEERLSSLEDYVKKEESKPR